MLRISFIATAFTLLMFSSCATIITGSRDAILFTSEPDGVKITMDDYVVGRTPVMLDVRRKIGGQWVRFERDGYESQYIKLTTHFNAVSVINLTSMLGWGVDAATGAIVRYDTPSLFVEMEPVLADTLQRP